MKINKEGYSWYKGGKNWFYKDMFFCVINSFYVVDV